jgi:menaquinone-dependent protoporphyrinogen oxidase
MKVLIVYSTRHGSTGGIAERIATTLDRRGLEVTMHTPAEAREIDGYDAYVIGAAAYMFHWLKDATGFVRHHRTLLATRPVWLFSNGPLGTETVDAKGRDAKESAVPKEFAEFQAAIHPRDAHVFFGAYDPTSSPIGLGERFTRIMPAARDALPAGDFRDWPEIDAWAGRIADELIPVAPAADPLVAPI